MEPHHEDRHIELSKIQVFGYLTDDNVPDSKNVQISLKKEPNFDIELSASNEKKSLIPHEVEVFAVNSAHDLTIDKIENIVDYVDLRLVAHVDSESGENVTLKSVELEGYSTLRINAIHRSKNVKKTSKEVDEEFNNQFKEYLLTR